MTVGIGNLLLRVAVCRRGQLGGASVPTEGGQGRGAYCGGSRFFARQRQFQTSTVSRLKQHLLKPDIIKVQANFPSYRTAVKFDIGLANLTIFRMIAMLIKAFAAK